MIESLYIESVGCITLEEAIKKHTESRESTDCDEENSEDLEYFDLMDEEVYAEGLAYTLTLTYTDDKGNEVTYSVDCSDIEGFDEAYKFEEEIFDDSLYVKWNLLNVDTRSGSFSNSFEMPEEMFEYLTQEGVEDYKRQDKVSISSIWHYYPLCWTEIEELLAEEGQ